MSNVSERARLSLTLADFANNDAVGKLNIIGGGIQIIGFDPGQGTTSRFSVAAQVELDAAECPADFVLELTLLDANGMPVPLPGADQMSPAGMPPQAFRIGQPARIDAPSVQGLPHLPPSLPGSLGIVIDFGNGVPVPAGQAYAWQLRIDGDADNAIVRPFFVPAVPSGPVFG